MVLSEKKQMNRMEKAVAAVLSLFPAFLIMLSSSLNPFYKTGFVNTDSAVFRTVAMLMGKGCLPYRDTFDHKGPVIYFLNYLGDSVISGKYGLWLVELLFAAFTVCMMYFTARLICTRSKAFIITMAAITLWLSFFQFGNYVEEYALPFIALSNYIFLDYLKNNRINAFKIVICGAGLGTVLMLRPNMIVVWIVYCIAVMIRLIKSKQIRMLIRYILLFVSGIILVFVPIIWWLAANDCLQSFWNVYVVFNLAYTSSGNTGNVWGDRINAFASFGIKPLILISLLVSGICAVIKKNKIGFLAFLTELLSLVFISVSGRVYNHYGMTIVPCIVFPMAMLFDLFNEIKASGVKKIVESSVVVLFSVVFVILHWLTSGLELYRNGIEDEWVDGYSRTTVNAISEVVISESGPDDRISVFGNWNCIYLVSGRMPATKYSYQYPPCYIDTDLMKEYGEQLKAEKPVLIVVQYGHYNVISPFLDEYGYELIWAEDDSDLVRSALVFKLKDAVDQNGPE